MLHKPHVIDGRDFFIFFSFCAVFLVYVLSYVSYFRKYHFVSIIVCTYLTLWPAPLLHARDVRLYDTADLERKWPQH